MPPLIGENFDERAAARLSSIFDLKGRQNAWRGVDSFHRYAINAGQRALEEVTGAEINGRKASFRDWIGIDPATRSERRQIEDRRDFWVENGYDEHSAEKIAKKEVTRGRKRR